MKHLKLFTLLLASCSTPAPLPTLAEAHPQVMAKKDMPGTKTYMLKYDWQGEGWAMKKGGLISFNADGTGLFEATVYGPDAARNVLYFQSVQSGKDGHPLFSFPGSDTGYAMHLRGANRDCVFTQRFGFDPRHYTAITDAKFLARLRRSSEGMMPVASSK